MLSLSTAYLKPKGKTGQELVDRARDLGFESIEINVEVEADQLKEISKIVDKGGILVSSVHNFSPRLQYVPAGQTIYGGSLFSSMKEDERKMAVTLTKQTIDTALRFNSSAVVIHAGQVDTISTGRDLFMYAQEFGLDAGFLKMREALLDERKRKRGGNLQNVIDNLSRINEYAVKKKVRLGLENRFYCQEIPDIEEIGLIISAIKENVYYWHDVGHAEIFARMGIISNAENYLEKYSANLLGIHLHDIKKWQDHLAPGVGEVDFSRIRKFMSPDTVKVVEAHSYSSEKELMDSFSVLASAGIC